MYSEAITEILHQVTNHLSNKPLVLLKEEYQVPQYMSTLDKHFNIKNYLIKKAEDYEEPMKGHVYSAYLAFKIFYSNFYCEALVARFEKIFCIHPE